MDMDEILDLEEAFDEADQEISYFTDPSILPSAPSSAPNSCGSSPPVNNEDFLITQHNFLENILSPNGNELNFLNGSVGTKILFNGGKGCNSKRGPGRPRKDFPNLTYRNLNRTSLKKKMCSKDFMQSKKSMLGISDDDRCIPNVQQSPSENLNMINLEGEKLYQTFDEMPYFPEKYPGKVCCLCNLGERSQLGQGEFLRLELKTFDITLMEGTQNNEDFASLTENNSSNSLLQIISNKPKYINKCKVLSNTLECTDELDKIGHAENVSFTSIQDGQYYYIHRMCATWSLGVTKDANGSLQNLPTVITRSLTKKCWYCNQYGASVACKMSCPKLFHLPCAAASSCFLIIESYKTFCADHLNQIPLICTENNIECRHCSSLGDISKLIMCSTCGDHYHSTCIGLTNLPGTRSGWQCIPCSKCQICRQPDSNDGRLLKCEQCHKVYHSHCFRPVISSIPKFGWKCRRCRICSDCGSRTPGAGASSRWHSHYTVCDSCYQQRNKGFSCPICHKAYRAAAHKEMVKCSSCNRFVHSTCDPEAELSVYHMKKENNPDYDFVCPSCKIISQCNKGNKFPIQIRSMSNVDNSLICTSAAISAGSSSNFYRDMDSDMNEKNVFDFANSRGKPFEAFKLSKKRMSFKEISRNRAKISYQKRTNMPDFGRKRGSKGKGRNIIAMIGAYSYGSQSNNLIERSNNRNDSDPGIENKLLLCSAKDKFILSQDICVMCGSVGVDQEGCLISCTQCGQCFHPYCVNIKVTKVVLKKGWRCLDCTVCEGCGQKNDEARLILCDECDISYHIYCMNPPLETVPHGNWKCKWCAFCQKCGSNSSGKNCHWKNSFSECGPCASQSVCCVCSLPYNENELIIQCVNCERWLHCKCDSIKSEDDAQECDNENYHCILCRPRGILPPHLISKDDACFTSNKHSKSSNIMEVSEHNASFQLEMIHFIDGICVSEHGLQVIKSLQTEIKKKRKMKLTNDIQKKDFGIMAAIESVVAGTSANNSLEESRIESQDPKEKCENYKDGMIWTDPEGSPPEGFTLFTNDEGVRFLRKKRQRNLQKMGIGGFNVKNRATKKDSTATEFGEENGDSFNSIEFDKKKKVVRKKMKSKLIETYPKYLQEAFFGKHLLALEKSTFLESDSSDSTDNKTSLISEDKVITLSTEELNILNNLKKEEQQSVVTENKLEYDFKLVDVKNVDSCTGVKNKEVNINKHKNSADKSLASIAPINKNLNDTRDSTIGAKISNTTTEDDLDVFMVNNVQSKPQIDKRALEHPQNKPQSGIHMIRVNPSVGFSSNSFITNFSCQVPASKRMVPDTHIVKTKPHLKEFHKVAIPTSTNSNKPFVETQVPQIQINQQQEVQHQDDDLNQMIQPNQTNSYLAQKPFEEPTELAVVGTQKTAEKMRRDEDLGEMATISAVLYANTQHPELKQMYPHWNDRCKQILKKWRSLSTEKKAPFLQHAKDNRSALRMQRAQQDQEKICSQQKALKEQEQERVWKQHQAKAKEVHLSIYGEEKPFESGSIDKMIDDNQNTAVFTTASVPGTTNPNFNANVVPNTMYASNIKPDRNLMQAADNTVENENVQTIVNNENKQLRELLRKQDFTMAFVNDVKQMTVKRPWVPDNNMASQIFPVQGFFAEPPSLKLDSHLDIEKVHPMEDSFGSRSSSDLVLSKTIKIKKTVSMQQVNLSKQDIVPSDTSARINKVKYEVKMPENHDTVPVELDKLEHDENAGIGDILGGLGEGDDDELLKSLTAEMGDDFNILEYADPELDELTTNQNILNKLDFDEGDRNTTLLTD